MKQLLLVTGALCFIQPAFAAGMGKWEMNITTTAPGQQPSTMKMTQCMDDAQMKTQATFGMGNSAMETDDGDCHVKAESKDNVYTMDSVCKSGEKTNSVTTITDTSITSTVTVTDKEGTTVTKTENKRLGDC